MAKAKKPPVKKKVPPKKRTDKYDEKLQVNGSFEDLVKALVNPKEPTKKK